MQKWDVSSELTDQIESAGLEIQPDTLSLNMRKIFGFTTSIFFRSGEKLLSRLQDILEFPLHVYTGRPRFA